MKDTKEKWIQNQCLTIENDMKICSHSKRAYQVLKNLTNTTQKDDTEKGNIGEG